MNENISRAETIRQLLRELSQTLGSAFQDLESTSYIKQLLQSLLVSPGLIDDLAELYRLKPEMIAERLKDLGLSPSGKFTTQKGTQTNLEKIIDFTAKLPQSISLIMRTPNGSLSDDASHFASATLEQEWTTAKQLIQKPDAFLSFYRSDIDSYLNQYRSQIQPHIYEFLSRHFSNGFRYLVTVGIGANEQFWHCPRAWYTKQNNDKMWFICDNPKDIANLPPDATVDNTIFLEFSRSGKTQETVKFHEFLDDQARIIIFANSGPLKQLAEMRPERTLLLPFPDAIPGRYGKNLTPLIIAPFEILELPVEDYWNEIKHCIVEWDLTSENCPPVAIAKFIRKSQLMHKINHIYLGCNDLIMRETCAELVQFWNEGVAKSENDILISHYLGLPRDSHFNIEGILGNSKSKMGIFLICKNRNDAFRHPLCAPQIRPVNPAHCSLTISDVDYLLSRANADHFSNCMPTIIFEIDTPQLLHTAVFSQLWADMTYCYARIVGLNPGSNPEVRLVRDRADELLAKSNR